MSLSKDYKHILLVCALFFFAFSASAEKWYVNSSTGDDLFDGKDPVAANPVGPFKHIAWAVQMAMPGDTIYVAEGVYEENITIDKSIRIFGNNLGVEGRATRNNESIIVPSATDLNGFPNSSTCVLYITADDVFLDGLMIDGNNSALSSGNDVRGSDVDVSYGVGNAGPFNSLWMQNTIVQNFNSGGVIWAGQVDNPNLNCGLRNNYIKNMGDGGVGINLMSGFYADILSNTIELADVGIKCNDFRTSNARSWQINGNIVRAFNIGVQIEQCYGSASSMLFENNLITTNGASIGDLAVYVLNNDDNFSISFSNNRYANFGEGISFTNNNIPPVLIEEDTFTNCDYGFRLNNFRDNQKVDTFRIFDCSFTNLNIGGLDIYSDSSRTDLLLDGTTFDNTLTAALLRGNCHIEPGNTEFTDITDYYIYIDDAVAGIRSGMEIDATACTFNGMTGMASSDSLNFINEDKFRHYLDENRFAYINFHDEHAYITSNDGNLFMTPAVLIASDGWNIHLDTMNQPEDVVLTKALNVYTRGDVSLGSFSLEAPGKTVTMHGPIALSNTLTMKSGILNTANGVVTVGQPSFAEPFNPVSGGGVTSYVDGPLQIVLNTEFTDTLYFPVGKGPDFRPLSIITETTDVDELGIIEVEANLGAAPMADPAKGITHISQIHHWKTNNMDGLTFDKVAFTCTYGTLTNDDLVSQPSSLRVVVNTNGEWQNLGGSGSAPGTGFITSQNPNQTMSYVSIANAAMGSNSLGLSGAVAAFDFQQACFPDSVAFTDISASSTGGIVAWLWNFGDTSTLADTSIFQNPKYQYPNPGMYDVRLIVLNSNLETDTIIRSIHVSGPPSAGFETTIPCFPSPVAFADTSVADATDPIVQWEWDIDGNSYSSEDVLHTFSAAGSHPVKLLVRSANGCVDSFSTSVMQGDTVQLSLSPTSPVSLCTGDTVVLTASGNAQSYEWSTNETTASITVNSAGTYVVTASNGNMCTAVDSVIVSILPSPFADAGPDQTIEFGESVTLTGSGNGSFQWTPSGTLSHDTIAEPVASPRETTTYVLRVYNSFGCEAYDTVLVNVTPLGDFDIPNLLTPNGDGENDVWDLSVVPGYDSSKVSVISRWGKQIFVSFNYQNDWDGTYNGEPVPEGTYLYIIENQDTFGVLKGSLLIIR